MTFNDKVDKFMEDNNIPDIKKLATNSGIPYTTLRDFYNKKSADNSRLSTIRKLAEYMNCSVDYLAFDEVVDPNIEQISNLEEIKKEDLEDLSALENVLYMKKGKIDSAKNLPEEKQKQLANLLSGVLDMVDAENLNNNE